MCSLIQVCSLWDYHCHSLSLPFVIHKVNHDLVDSQHELEVWISPTLYVCIHYMCLWKYVYKLSSCVVYLCAHLVYVFECVGGYVGIHMCYVGWVYVYVYTHKKHVSRFTCMFSCVGEHVTIHACTFACMYMLESWVGPGNKARWNLGIWLWNIIVIVFPVTLYRYAPIDGFHGVWFHFRRARVGVCV